MASRKNDQVPALSKSEITWVRTRRHMVGVPGDVHALLVKIATRHKRTISGQIAFWVDRETII